MHLLVGLGNNGLNYARHRHNVGRMVLDSLSDCLERGPWQSLGHGRLTAVSEDCLLLVPTTAMNLTGAAVEEVCALHGIPPGNVCVFHDDMDIPVGTVRMKCGGSDAGHNGLKSVSSSIGSQYHRFRIGIGRPPEGIRVTDFVLSDLSLPERQEIDRVCDVMEEQLDALAAGNFDAVSDFVGRRLKRLPASEAEPALSPPASWRIRRRYGDIGPAEEMRRRLSAGLSGLPAQLRSGIRTLRSQVRTGTSALMSRPRRDRTKATVIGVTGSSAKTTTVTVLTHILSERHRVKTQAETNTLPTTLKTLSSLRRDDDFAVMELGASAPGTIAEMTGYTKPHIGIVTMVGREHYSAFRAREAVAEEKGNLIAALPPEGLAILNADDPMVAAMAARTAARVVTFGTGNADYVCSDLRSGIEGLSFRLDFRGRGISIRSSLIGPRNWLALTAAAACALELGIPDDEVSARIASLEQLFGRMSVHAIENGPVFILDIVKAPYDSIPMVLDELAQFDSPRKRLVLANFGDYTGNPMSKYAEVYRDAREVADEVIFVAEAAHQVKPTKADIETGRFRAFPDLEELSRYIKSSAVPGELIFVKGSRATHLDRIFLDWQTDVKCWARACPRKSEFCESCGLYGRPYAEHQGKRKRSRGLKRLLEAMPSSASARPDPYKWLRNKKS
jgi:UDP-N-acetylmuramoyl-tripeptide--D-alanyl-D-alanine ligase